jgi:MFS family permease
MMALALGATVVNRWFTERRGLAMGILTASSATGQLVFLPLLAAVVESHGWQTVTLAGRRDRAADNPGDRPPHA